MGDTYRDPVDHLRTTRPLAGESLIDVLHWPGYILVIAGIIGIVASIAAFGTGHRDDGMTAAGAAIVVMTLGLVWVALEHRRIRIITERWYAEHPEVPKQQLCS